MSTDSDLINDAHADDAKSEPTSAAALEPAVTDRTKVALNLGLAGFALLVQVAYILGISGAILKIMVTLNATIPEITWFPNAVSLVLAILGPGTGRISDSFGRKIPMVVMATLGAVGCAVTATAHSPGAVIAGCAVGGVGYMGSLLSYSIASEITPRMYRPAVQAYMSIMAVTGACLGLVGVGAFCLNSATTQAANTGSWRNFFWLMCACYLVVALSFVFCYRPPPRAMISSKTASLDIVGNVLFATGLTLFLVGMTIGGGSHPWKSGVVIGLLVAGALFLVLFGLHGRWGRDDGLLHHGLFRRRNFILCLIAVMIEGWIFTANLGWLAQEIGVLFEPNVLLGNARFWVYQAASLPTSAIVGYISYKTKRVRELLVIGYIIFLGGVIGFSQATPGDSKASIGWTALFGVGFSIPLLLLLVVVQFSVPPELIATATALFFSARSFAGSIGNAIFSAIFTAKFTDRLGPYIAEAVLPLGLLPTDLPAFIGSLASGDIATLSKLHNVTPQMIGAGFAGYQRAWADSARYGWYSLMGPVVIGIVSCALLQPINEDMNNQIDAPVNGAETTKGEEEKC